MTKNSLQCPLELPKSSYAHIQTLMKQSMPSPMDSSPPYTTAPWPPVRNSTPVTPESSSSTTNSLCAVWKSPASKDDWELSTSPLGSSRTWATLPTLSPSAQANKSSHSSSEGWVWERSRCSLDEKGT